MTTPQPFFGRSLILFRGTIAAWMAFVLAGLMPAREAAAVKKSFNVPAGDAPTSLKQFAQQSGVELLYSPKEIEGTKTNAVKGYLTPREALAKLLDGTKLIATPGKTSGALAVTRAADPNG